MMMTHQQKYEVINENPAHQAGNSSSSTPPDLGKIAMQTVACHQETSLFRHAGEQLGTLTGSVSVDRNRSLSAVQQVTQPLDPAAVHKPRVLEPGCDSDVGGADSLKDNTAPSPPPHACSCRQSETAADGRRRDDGRQSGAFHPSTTRITYKPYQSENGNLSTGPGQKAIARRLK
ncbi:hypothetical protein GWI33_005291 [Rhynchophorus ferrugineus]|uniref:Uncharacterized protein n=1 Tax=Rhynchophorus ferrugineus TaxID=354439 RepID=A0A834IN71_RHYFE|nr:hypothetical protein GWI33_005291 [Rhynchophorus ferrugineus]